VRACDCRREFFSSSPAMLITRSGGRVGCALAVAYCQRRVHREALPKSTKKSSLGEPGGGARGVRGSMRCIEGASADSGVHARVMKLDDLIDHDPHRPRGGAVFVGTSVPIKLLFEFLEDDQTMDTFLDQFPMVTRDQARAVLGASRDMLLSAAGSET